jgi:nicotinate-nucleotide pyrophosphorylase (carboxylating)
MQQIDTIIASALAEDIHTGDITTMALMVQSKQVTGFLKAKEELVLSGLDVAGRVFAMLDQSTVFTPLAKDGDRVPNGR